MQKIDTACRIFVVEDDPLYQRMVRYVAELNPEHEVHVFSTGQDCLDHLDLNPHLVSLDYSLPDLPGEKVLKRIKAFREDIGVIILSNQQKVSTAVGLLKAGAFDYITKDEEVKQRLLNAINLFKRQHQLQREVEELREEVAAKYEFSHFVIGSSQPIQRVFRLMRKAVQSNITVSLHGETGSGKEVVAKSIHYNSPRREGPFIPVNMGAIPEELAESELFGHEKGAFTGAVSRKRGVFELSDQGTLFLDEVAEIPLHLQVKLLRAVQERTITRVGGEDTVPFDTRIIIATHQDLAAAVKAGRFREDLYYRLLGLKIMMPPLRERDGDIIQLADHFLKEFVAQNRLPAMAFSKPAKSKLLGYHFPGNVRELKAIVELAAVMADGNAIQEEDIDFQSPQREQHFLTESLTMEEYKRRIVFHFLEKYNKDVPRVAQLLDIGKSTIYRMLKEKKKQM